MLTIVQCISQAHHSKPNITVLPTPAGKWQRQITARGLEPGCDHGNVGCIGGESNPEAFYELLANLPKVCGGAWKIVLGTQFLGLKPLPPSLG